MVRVSSRHRSGLLRQGPMRQRHVLPSRLALQSGAPSVASTMARALFAARTPSSATAAASSAGAVGVEPLGRDPRSRATNALALPRAGSRSGELGTAHVIPPPGDG